MAFGAGPSAMDITILVCVCGGVEAGTGRSNHIPGGLKEGQNEKEGRRCTEAKSA